MDATDIALARCSTATRHLAAAAQALCVASDISTPFYRGEDVRENHRAKFTAEVVHWSARLDEARKLLNVALS